MIHITKKFGGKLKGIVAINTNTLSNNFCKKMQRNKHNVCANCYAKDFLKTFRASCVAPFERNSKLLSKSLVKAPFLNHSYVRFNAYGEIINDTHFINLCNIASANPATTFALWTKRKDVVKKLNRYIPDNMILIYSSPKMNVKASLPKYFHKVFTVFSEEAEGINCTGHCTECLLCYTKDNGIDEINERLRSRGRVVR